MRYPSHISIVEVGPRDGLQNEAATVSTDDKVAFVDRLSNSGLPAIEVSAFVSPKWVPQMADAADVFENIARLPDTRYSALVPNMMGLERAHAAGVKEVAVVTAASESFSRRNINQGIGESLDDYRVVCAKAAQLGIRVRGYVSTAFGCPFEGPVDEDRVAELCWALIDMGAFEVAVSDTIGVAQPGQVARLIDGVAGVVPMGQIALHFHDTRGLAAVNVMAAMEVGVRTFDASAGGLGGCPYAPGATGNLATEDLVYLLDGLGLETGVDLRALLEASAFIESRIGRPLPSRFYRASRGSRREGGPHG